MTKKEQSPSPVPDHSQDSYHPQKDEINFLDLLEALLKKKALIIIALFVCTLPSIFYAQSAIPTYKASIGFLPPDETILAEYFHASRILSGGPLKVFSDKAKRQKREHLFLSFLKVIRSKELQEKVFVEGNFVKKFIGNESDAKTRKEVFREISNSIRIKPFDNPNQKKFIDLFDGIAYLELSGEKPEAMSDFLNSLGDAAIKDTAKNIKESLQRKISLQLISYSERLESLRIQKNQARIEQIRYLSENLEIAKNLGILENNLGSDMGVLFGAIYYSEINSKQKGGIRESLLPLWYLYGQRALEQKIAMLKSQPPSGRSIKGAAEITSEIENLSKLDLSKVFFKPAMIGQLSTPPTEPSSLGKIEIIAIGALIGLIAGIMLAFIGIAIDQLKQKSKSTTLT
jgi:LPS O-antigen subunit length determinant protein (WzzB/FepE family)